MTTSELKPARASSGKGAFKDDPPTAPHLVQAPVPWHSQVVIVGMLSFFVYTFPSVASLDESATMETFTSIQFPEYVSLEVVVALRLFFAFIIIFDCTYAILWGNWDQDTDYEAESKLMTITISFRGILLQPDKSILRGLLTMSSFTMISWMVLGIAFFLCGLVPLLHMAGHSELISPSLLRVTLLTFECAAPTTMLVSAVVKYVLWPLALENGSGNTEVFRNPATLLEHNGNVLMAITEIALLGKLPVRLRDFSVAPLFGIAYVFFSWWMVDKWTSKEKGPQYIYPFFDTTLGWTATISLVVLLAVLAFFYFVFASLDYSISLLSGGIWTHFVAVALTAFAVCRFRD